MDAEGRCTLKVKVHPEGDSVGDAVAVVATEESFAVDQLVVAAAENGAVDVTSDGETAAVAAERADAAFGVFCRKQGGSKSVMDPPKISSSPTSSRKKS